MQGKLANMEQRGWTGPPLGGKGPWQEHFSGRVVGTTLHEGFLTCPAYDISSLHIIVSIQMRKLGRHVQDLATCRWLLLEHDGKQPGLECMDQQC